MNEEIKAYGVELPLEMWNVILTGLGRLPAEISFDTITSTKSQLEKQISKDNSIEAVA